MELYAKLKRDYPVILVLVTITLALTTYYFVGYDTGNPTITGDYFSADSANSSLSSYYEDIGSEECVNINLSNYWKLNSYWGDQGYYILQAQGKESIAPYKYRILTPFLAGISYNYFLKYLSGIPIANFTDDVLSGFAFINFIFIFLYSYVLYMFLQELKFDNKYSLIGSILFLSSISILQVGTLPMVDAGTYFFMVTGLYSIYKNNDTLFLVTAILGILNKETLAILVPIFLVNRIDVTHNYITIENVKSLIISAVPLITFIFPRYYYDNSVTVNYGYNILNGEFPTGYIINHLTYPGIITEFFGIFSSFLFLWIGVKKYKANLFIYRSLVIALPLIIVAQLFFASRTTRIIFQIFPLIIACFLYYLYDKFE